jgi:hypothetical protein
MAEYTRKFDPSFVGIFDQNTKAAITFDVETMTGKLVSLLNPITKAALTRRRSSTYIYRILETWMLRKRL